MLAISCGYISAPAAYAVAFPFLYKYRLWKCSFCPTPTLRKDKSQNSSLKFILKRLCNQLVRAGIITRDNSSKKRLVMVYWKKNNRQTNVECRLSDKWLWAKMSGSSQSKIQAVNSSRQRASSYACYCLKSLQSINHFSYNTQVNNTENLW